MKAASPSDMPRVTFAVVCKNEAANIERCLASIVRESENLPSEILVVDSFSTDGTVELAKQYPVTIVQLGCDWPHSPSAGRYTAAQHARGKYLLLIDGDMELLPGFTQTALARMDADLSVVAIRGRLHNYHMQDGKQQYVNSCLGGRFVDISKSDHEDVERELRVATGSAIFRLSALLDAGNFHPFLMAEEEFEVAQRLLSRGGKLLYTPVDAVHHYGYLPEPMAEFRRRLRRGLVGGIGQMARLSFKEGYGLKNLFRFRVQLLMSLFFALLAPALMLAPIFPLFLTGWIVSFGLLLCAYRVKKRSLIKALVVFLQNILIGFEITKGLFVPIPPKESYPTDVTIITCVGHSR